MPPSETEPGPRRAAGPVVGAIPARYGSTRLPGKVLMPLAGRPMIEHVWRRASRAEGLERVGEEIGMEISVRLYSVYEAMHRI